MKTIKICIAALNLLFTTGGHAAFIALPFETVVQNVSNGTEVGIAVGDVFQGLLVYDDAKLTQQNGNLVASSDNLLIDFPFNFAQTPSGLFVNSATFSATGILIDLDFSIDVPFQFFFSTQGLTFNFEFSRLENIGDEPTQVIVAKGSGTVRGAVMATPLPGAVWLFLSGIAFLVDRHRKQS